MYKRQFENVRQCYPQFQPDGGWYEGAGYWNYAMQFWTYMMAASQTALGTDFGHRFGEGISETGYFPLYMTGAKQIFNFGDAGAVSLSTPCLFYLGKIFEDKYLNGYRYYQLEYELSLIHIWFMANRKPLLPLTLARSRVSLHTGCGTEKSFSRPTFTDLAPARLWRRPYPRTSFWES